jgi:hypothetical protein
VNNGGVLWINDLAKYETDDFENKLSRLYGLSGWKMEIGF